MFVIFAIFCRIFRRKYFKNHNIDLWKLLTQLSLVTKLIRKICFQAHPLPLGPELSSGHQTILDRIFPSATEQQKWLVSRDQFYKTPFCPEFFIDNFHPKIFGPSSTHKQHA
jgi:hypothetical protein